MEQKHMQPVTGNTSGGMIQLNTEGENKVVKIAAQVFGFIPDVTTTLGDVLNSIEMAFIQNKMLPLETPPLNEQLFKKLSRISSAAGGGRHQPVKVTHYGENSPVGTSSTEAVDEQQVRDFFQSIKGVATEKEFKIDIKFGESAISQDELNNAGGDLTRERKEQTKAENHQALLTKYAGKNMGAAKIEAWRDALGGYSEFFEQAGLFRKIGNSSVTSRATTPTIAQLIGFIRYSFDDRNSLALSLPKRASEQQIDFELAPTNRPIAEIDEKSKAFYLEAIAESVRDKGIDVPRKEFVQHVTNGNANIKSLAVLAKALRYNNGFEMSKGLCEFVAADDSNSLNLSEPSKSFLLQDSKNYVGISASPAIPSIFIKPFQAFVKARCEEKGITSVIGDGYNPNTPDIPPRS